MDKKEIQKELLYLGIRPSLKGFEHIAAAIEIYKPGDKITGLYKVLAARYNTTSAAIERTIRHALELMIDKHIETLENKIHIRYGIEISLLFGITNGDFIAFMKFALESKEDKHGTLL